MSSANCSPVRPPIAVIGLGYVGLPLAVAFGNIRPTIGFDINSLLINKLREKSNVNGPVSAEDLAQAKYLSFTDNRQNLKIANVYIITVPTPITNANTPDLTAIEHAVEIISENITRGDLVILESTVWPGLTKEILTPLLEKKSGLKSNDDFNVGYSPERINPGDSEHTLESVVKIVAGDCDTTLEKMKVLYGEIISAGIFCAQSIEVAEAAKVIENVQRDINIALMNELSNIFDRMGISTTEVLKAANTKWNFLDFTPGLVGGHCIGVDPHYLTYKAQKIGLYPEMILAGRRVNENVSKLISQKIIKLLNKTKFSKNVVEILVLGVTFKENVSDIRNSKVPVLASELREYGCNVSLHDPLASKKEFTEEYGLKLCSNGVFDKQFSCVILAVPHDKYLNKLRSTLHKLVKPNGVFVDLKSAINLTESETKTLKVWRL